MEEKYMKIAIKEAKKAFEFGEVPVGAVIVCNNKIISKGYNKKEIKQNALMHAEIIAINKACNKKKSWRLNDCEIYVTMEPCNMCMGAILESRISKVYCGIINDKTNIINRQILENKNTVIKFGVLQNEIEKMVNCFFEKIRSK